MRQGHRARWWRTPALARRSLKAAMSSSSSSTPLQVRIEKPSSSHKLSDLIVQPTGASADDLRPAVLLFHELVKAGIPRERLIGAICRIMSDTEEAAARGYLQAAGYDVLPGSIPERPTYREAQNRGAAITETKLAQLNERADTLMEALLRAITRALSARVDAALVAREAS